ncbi:MAG: hypothetical protein A2161_21200 [Candidatus Schekmanbacteria bacterium RBG_13_48_7]|uniref:Peptidase S54 rhomboid domain-containing protein n=1 Tax=Candidatus Schekmanbacteria bacterium RBG_13_48_7 TaxID=1817878 RepID=A0A1F7RX04_9BACT|nr:MAG: hypothetical protein A2161_21200 [Candidatus Schekmanbacteria bacterium RBG_13_48_7]
MIFLLPFGHDAYIKKIPYVTFVLIGINVLIFLITSQIVPSREENFSKVKIEYDFFRSVAYQKYSQEIEKELGLEEKDLSLIKKIKIIENEIVKRLNEHKFNDLSQEEYDQWNNINDKYQKAKDKLIFPKYGFVPGNFKFYGLITSLFLHAGFFHLFGNMLFLYLAGAAVEERWGSVAFAVFYFAAGISADLSHAVDNMHSMEPCIGASGAIAGLMGVFLARFYNARIKFFYLYFWPLYPRFGTFSATAKIMLPLWLGSQLLQYMFMSDIANVAFLAHIGGFFFGLIVAAIIVKCRFEGKLLEVSEDLGSTKYKVSPRLIEANKLFDTGKTNESIAIYREILKHNSNDYDANYSILHAYFVSNMFPEAVPHVEWLLQYYQKHAMNDEIIELCFKLKEKFPDKYLGSKIKFAIAKSMEELGDWEYANAEYNEIIKLDSDERQKNKAMFQKARIFRDKLGKPEKALLLYELIQTKDTAGTWKEVIQQEIQLTKRHLSGN